MKIITNLFSFKLLVICTLVLGGFVVGTLDLPKRLEAGSTLNLLWVLAALIVLGILVAVFESVKLLKDTKIFLVNLSALVAVFVIVFLTGGIFSYFVFLFFLPNLYAASEVSARRSFFITVLTSVLLVAALSQVQKENFSEAIGILSFYLFGVWLMTSLGRSLARQISVVHKHREELEVEQIKILDKVKDEFVFIIAHELRSPITAVRGYLQIILEDKEQKTEESLKKLLEKSFTTSTRVANLVALLLEIARMETGKIHFYIQNVTLFDSVNFVLKSLQTDREEKDIEINVAVDKDTEVSIDKERLGEILTILVDNAIKYTPEFGKINITLEKKDDETILSVSDSGVGIAPELAEKLFEKYYYEDEDSDRAEVKSYGVSLYAAKQLMLLMKGDITYESAVGKGSTFYLHMRPA